MNVVEIRGLESLIETLRTVTGFQLDRRTFKPDSDGYYCAWGLATNEAIEDLRQRGATVNIIMNSEEQEAHAARVFSQIGKDSTSSEQS
jgi:hypothetical protein